MFIFSQEVYKNCDFVLETNLTAFASQNTRDEMKITAELSIQ